jgi:cob(I)alamin adenosyltransferase
MTVEPPRAHENTATHRASSLVMVNTGHGKGKTTAAMGVVLRSLARGWKVSVMQFMKSGKWHSGEAELLEGLGATWRIGGDGFTWIVDDLERSKALAQHAWEQVVADIASGGFDLILLDEITYPMNYGWIDTAEVLRALRDRPEQVNVLLTGRDAPEEIIAIADTVTEMHKVKHAYDAGIRAKKGIDY